MKIVLQMGCEPSKKKEFNLDGRHDCWLQIFCGLASCEFGEY